MVNPSGVNGHYNGTRMQPTSVGFLNRSELFLGPPDDILEAALHSYASKSLRLDQRLDYLQKDFNFKIRYTFLTTLELVLNLFQYPFVKTPQSQIQSEDCQKASPDPRCGNPSCRGHYKQCFLSKGPQCNSRSNFSSKRRGEDSQVSLL
jgi:hypothetical protein